MSKSLKGTDTLENLMKAFAGESQARGRYTMYAAQARKDGFRQIENVFLETADNERVHAKRFFDYALEGLGDEAPLMVDIHASYPVCYKQTKDNLIYAADGEHEEWEILYPQFAQVAKEEGFPQVSALFTRIAAIEAHHEERYRKLAELVAANSVFKKGATVKWKCLVCGHVHEGLEAPTVCPTCAHKQEHFELLVERY